MLIKRKFVSFLLLVIIRVRDMTLTTFLAIVTSFFVALFEDQDQLISSTLHCNVK